MSLLELFKKKRLAGPIEPPIEPDDHDDLATMTVTTEEREAAQKGEYKIPVAVGEYFPWKGHVFQITEVGAMTFSAQCKGLTRRRAEKLGLF